jgi:hypothetical protein
MHVCVSKNLKLYALCSRTERAWRFCKALWFVFSVDKANIKPYEIHRANARQMQKADALLIQ